MSSKQWLVDILSGWGDTGEGGSGLTTKLENQYASIRERILSRASAYPLSGSTLIGNDLNTAIDTANGAAGNNKSFTYEFGGFLRWQLLRRPDQ